MEIRSWLENIEVGIVKNGCDHSVLRTLKLAVCQGEMDVINWFLVCCYKFRKAKSYFNNFWVVVVKNGRGLLGLITLKCAVSQEPINEMSWFFVCSYKFRKAESYFNPLQPGVAYLYPLKTWFLCTDNDGIVFGLTSNLLCIFDI